MHVMLIEDDPATALDIFQALKKNGVEEVTLVPTEEAAVAAAEKKCPDLIIADFNLKQGDGISAIRSICTKRHVPHFYLTASPDHVRSIVPDALIHAKPMAGAAVASAVAAFAQAEWKI